MKQLMTMLLAAACASLPAVGQATQPTHPANTADAASTVAVVAAENFYGDVVRQLGGDAVALTVILSSPDQDPHMFEASPATARALTTARLVVFNGANYDPWIETLLKASPAPDRTTVVAATLVGRKAGDNPHLWYDPRTMPAVARQVSDFLVRSDPPHADRYRARLATFLASLRPIDAKIAGLRARYAGAPVAATEPVFTYLTDAVGLKMQGQSLQTKVMNETEPSASEIAAFEQDLTKHRVRVLIFNTQTASRLTRRLRAVAEAAHVPVVPVTETMPPGKDYQSWVMGELDGLERALDRPAR